MARHRIAALAGIFAPLVAAAGCSLVNTFGAVEGSNAMSSDDATTDDASSDDGTTPTGDGAMASETSTANEAASDVVTSDVTTVGSDGASDAMTTTTMPEATVDAGPAGGAIVISGTISGTEVLTVIDPVSGMIMNTPTDMAVAAIAYDPYLDLWYIFDTGMADNAFASPGTPVTLHVRKLDTRSGGTWKWTELATVSVPPIFSGQEVTALVNRLAYVSYAPADSGSTYALTVIDTTTFGSSTPDAALGSITNTLLTPFAGSGYPDCLASVPSSGSTGGTLALVQNQTTTGGTLQFYSIGITGSQITVNASGIPLGASPTAGTVAGCGSSVYGGNLQYLFAVPTGTGGDAGVTGATFEEWGTGNQNGQSVTTGNSEGMTSTATRFLPIVSSYCAPVAFAGVGLAPGGMASVYAVPLTLTAGTLVPSYSTSAQAISAMAYDPFNETLVITGAASGAAFITGLKLGGTTTVPTLSNRSFPPLSNWSAPTNLTARFIASRAPNACP
jgi:hypothetical protein